MDNKDRLYNDAETIENSSAYMTKDLDIMLPEWIRDLKYYFGKHSGNYKESTGHQ